MTLPVTPITLRSHGALLIALAITGFVLVGVCAISVGLLLDPLMAEFGWNNAATSAVATVYSLSALLSGPLVGVVIDRWGSKFVMLIGTLMVVAGYGGLGYCHTLWGFYAAFVLIGIGYGGAFFLASSTLIAARMGNHKNIGMGIWMLAGSTGAALFSLIVTWSITNYGWRHTALYSALLIAAMLPLMLLLIPGHSPAPTTPGGRQHEQDGHGAQLQPVELDSDSRAIPWPLLIAPAFLILSGASALAAFGMSAVYFHAVPILLKAGFTQHSAGNVLGASWLVSGLGSFALGAISNRFGVANILRLSLIASAVGTLGLLGSSSTAAGFAAAGLFVVLWGATANGVNQFLPILIVERFGTAHLGVLVGVQGALMGLVGSFAPLVTGALYDHYASYAAAIMASVATTLAAAVLILFLRGERTPIVPA